jgi:hypothetical protein
MKKFLSVGVVVMSLFTVSTSGQTQPKKSNEEEEETGALGQLGGIEKTSKAAAGKAQKGEFGGAKKEAESGFDTPNGSTDTVKGSTDTVKGSDPTLTKSTDTDKAKRTATPSTKEKGLKIIPPPKLP